MKTKILLILGILSLTLACNSAALNPYVQTIVPGREEPSSFRFSPDRHKMVYNAKRGHFVLNLTTGKKTRLFELHKGPWLNVSWVDNRYLYSRSIGTRYLQRPRLVVDTETWAVRDIRELPAAEQTRIEAGWEQHLYDRGDFVGEVPYYAPNGQYYFITSRRESDNIHDYTVVIYTADGRELSRYYGYVVAAEWAYDSSGVYLLLYKMHIVELAGGGDAIVKLLVPRGK